MLRWLMAYFAWRPVYFSAELEVEYNKVTKGYRHRGIKIVGDAIVAGDWVDGMPDPARYRVDLDDLLPPDEMARRLVPLWGRDTKERGQDDA